MVKYDNWTLDTLTLQMLRLIKCVRSDEVSKEPRTPRARIQREKAIDKLSDIETALREGLLLREAKRAQFDEWKKTAREVKRWPPEAIERLSGVLWRLVQELPDEQARAYWQKAIIDIENVIDGHEPKTKVTPPGHRQPPPRMLERFTDERGRGYVDPKRGKIYTHEKIGGLELSDDDLALILNWASQVHRSVTTAFDTRLRRKIEAEQSRRARK